MSPYTGDERIRARRGLVHLAYLVLLYFALIDFHLQTKYKCKKHQLDDLTRRGLAIRG